MYPLVRELAAEKVPTGVNGQGCRISQRETCPSVPTIIGSSGGMAAGPPPRILEMAPRAVATVLPQCTWTVDQAAPRSPSPLRANTA